MFRFLRQKKVLIPLVLLLIGGYFYVRSTNKPPQISIAVVKRSDIVKTVSASGNITAGPNRDLYALASGTVQKILVADNQQVTAGQQLIQLDSLSLAAAAETAHSALETAKKTLEDVSKKTLSETQRITLQSAVDQTKQIHDNAQTVAKANPFSPSAQDALATAKLNYETARKNLEEAGRQAPTAQEFKAANEAVTAANQNYTKALNDVGKSAITAPESGIFVLANPSSAAGTTDTSRKLTEGMSVTAGQKLAQIVDAGTLYFESEVDETEIPEVKAGQPAVITLNAFGDKQFKSTVGDTGNLAFNTSSGATAYKTWLKITETDKLKLGMNGDVEIEVDRHPNVLYLPSEAIKDKENGSKIVEIRDGKNYKEIEVKTGLTNDIQTEVTDGVTEDQEIIVSRSNKK